MTRALEHVHSRHIIHRDIKPENILLTREGVAKLADLGLAKNLEETNHLTLNRQGFGTTPYMPYEQALNARRADERSDIYALGATFYHLVTGELPFQGNNDLEVIDRKRLGEYPPARHYQPDLPKQVDHLLRRMLGRDPADRYQTARELRLDLERSGLTARRPQLRGDCFRLGLTCRALPPPSCRRGSTFGFRRLPRRPPTQGAVWHIRYRKDDGLVRKRKGTTDQIKKRLQAGRLPAGAELRRCSRDPFHPVDFFPEFRQALSVSGMQHNPPSRSLRAWLLLVGVSRMLFSMLAGAAALRLLSHRLGPVPSRRAMAPGPFPELWLLSERRTRDAMVGNGLPGHPQADSIPSRAIRGVAMRKLGRRAVFDVCPGPGR